jgi:hypothetical protein
VQNVPFYPDSAFQVSSITPSKHNFSTSGSHSVPKEQIPTPDNSGVRDGDQERTNLRYTEAVRQLKEALAIGRQSHSCWQTFEFPNTDDVSEGGKSLFLKEELDRILTTWKLFPDNPNAWSMCKRTIKQMFWVFSPFAQNFLLIAKEGANVPTPGVI